MEVICLKKRNILTIVIVFFFAFFGWVLYQNKALGVTTYEIGCSFRPKLSGFTIVQISDLHNETFGKKQKRIIEVFNSEIKLLQSAFNEMRSIYKPQIENKKNESL